MLLIYQMCLLLRVYVSSVYRFLDLDQDLCNPGDLIHCNKRSKVLVWRNSKNVLEESNMGIPYQYLRWPLLEISASGFGVPLRAASCCSRAFDSKYSSHAAASCSRTYHSSLQIFRYHSKFKYKTASHSHINMISSLRIINSPT